MRTNVPSSFDLTTTTCDDECTHREKENAQSEKGREREAAESINGQAVKTQMSAHE